MTKISVIIPVFNGGEYLKRCLESIAFQTMDEIEIIIVDNCSTDDSPRVIREFVEHWSGRRKIVSINETKQGNSYARNTGILHAHGEYIAFADQDDLVKPDFFEYMYNEALKENADVITSGYEAIMPNGMTKRVMRLKPCEWSPFRMVSPWGKLYKKSLIEKHNLSFLSVNKGEDVYFVLNAYNYAEKICVVKKIGYQWLSNSQSFSHTEHRKINEENSIIPLFNVLQESLYPLKHINRDYLEYFFIKTIVHETIFCAKGKNFETAYGYYQKLINWIDDMYPANEQNRYVGIFKPDGEEFKRRIFVCWFWHMKKRKTIDRFLKIFTRIFQ